MPLNNARATQMVQHWSAVLSTPFSQGEVQSLADHLVGMSGYLVPHMVMDEPLSADQQQDYLAARTVAWIDDWLTMAMAPYRRMFSLDTTRLRSDRLAPAVGLKSASHDEIEALPAVGDALTSKIRRFLNRYPATTDMQDLTALNGVGPDRVATLEGVAYLEQPGVGLMSPTLWQLIQQPDVSNMLRLLENTDLFLIRGDHNLLSRRMGTLGGMVFERFSAWMEAVSEQASLGSTTNGGVLASEAARYLQRHALRHDLLENRLSNADGELLLNGAYVASAKALIDQAQQSLSLMIFLGTTSAGDGVDPVPLVLVEAMEAAAARGVGVRVIMDQDDGGEPYGSLFINQPLVDRFSANGVTVKFDQADTLLHSKVLVADASRCIVGSHNWTRNGFNRTAEMSVLIDNATVASAFGNRFDTLWGQLP